MATTALKSANLACTLSRLCRTVAPRLCVASKINHKLHKNYSSCQNFRKPALLKVKNSSEYFDFEQVHGYCTPHSHET